MQKLLQSATTSPVTAAGTLELDLRPAEPASAFADAMQTEPYEEPVSTSAEQDTATA